MLGRWMRAGGAAAAAALLLAGCWGGWLFGIVESFGSPNGAKITTIGGTGTAGYTGDNGPATGAELNQPSGLAFDSAGNLYIADTNNNVVRKIDTSGTITTVTAFGTLDSPLSIAVDSSNNLYVADSNQGEVQEVSGITLTTFMSGLNSPADPTGVAASGLNIYVVDFNKSVIYENLKSTIVAGKNGIPGYTGDGGPATSAELNYPYGVAVDSAGNIYIADSTNAVIRKVTPGGTISTIAGNNIVGYSGDNGPATSAQIDLPTSLAVDSAGNLYIADRNNNVIRKVSPGGTISTVAGNWHLGNGFAGDGGVATAAMLNLPWGVAVDSAGNLYIADTKNNRIRKVTFAQ